MDALIHFERWVITRPNNRIYACLLQFGGFSIQARSLQFQICSMEFLLSYTDRVLLSVAVTATSLLSMFLCFYYVYLKQGSIKVWKPEESTAFFRVPLEEGTSSDPNHDVEMEEKLLKIEQPLLQCMVWSSQPLPTTFLHRICSSCPCMCTILEN